MYGGWKKGGAHTREWMNKSQEFIDRAFSLPNNGGVKCPCSRCRNAICEYKRTLTLHLCNVGFMPGYEVWTHHGESVRQTTLVAE
jgi:cytidine deaminase